MRLLFLSLVFSLPSFAPEAMTYLGLDNLSHPVEARMYFEQPGGYYRFVKELHDQMVEQGGEGQLGNRNLSWHGGDLALIPLRNMVDALKTARNAPGPIYGNLEDLEQGIQHEKSEMENFQRLARESKREVDIELFRRRASESADRLAKFQNLRRLVIAFPHEVRRTVDRFFLAAAANLATVKALDLTDSFLAAMRKRIEGDPAFAAKVLEKMTHEETGIGRVAKVGNPLALEVVEAAAKHASPPVMLNELRSVSFYRWPLSTLPRISEAAHNLGLQSSLKRFQFTGVVADPDRAIAEKLSADFAEAVAQSQGPNSRRADPSYPHRVPCNYAQLRR